MENKNLTKEFMKIYEILVKYSEGKLKIVEYSINNKTQHFLLLNNKERIGEDVESMSNITFRNKIHNSLLKLSYLIYDLRFDCIESYRQIIPELKKLGNNVLDDQYVSGWNRLIESNFEK